MGSLGINVQRDGRSNLDHIATVFPAGSWLRIVLTPYSTQTQVIGFLRRAREIGFKVLGLLVNESFHSEDGVHNWDWEHGINHYLDNFWWLIDALQVGNEWDHESPSSWTLSYDRLNHLLWLVWKARTERGHTYPLILGGSVSGDASRLDGVNLDYVDAVSFHPYGQRPSPHFRGTPGDFGFVGDLYNNYVQHARGKPVIITEVGVSSDEVSEDLQGRYMGEMAKWARDKEDLWFITLFCWDYTGGFAIAGEDGSEKPACDAIRRVAESMPNLPVPPSPPLPAPDWRAWFQYGFLDKANQLGEEAVGAALEYETYFTFDDGRQYSFQLTEKGLMVYSKGSGVVKFIPAVG